MLLLMASTNVSLEIACLRLEVLRSVISDIMYWMTIKGYFGRKFLWCIE